LNVARPVPAAAEPPAAGKFRDLLRRPARFQVTVGVREANHGIRIGDIHKLGIGAGRIKSDTKWLPQAGGEGLNLFCLAVFG
jgi:hypothetical protein